MIYRILFLLAAFSLSAHAQNWSGILAPTYGTGACTLAPSNVPAGCGVDWTQVGIPGGLPTGTQAGSMIAASTCSNGASDCTSTINTALSSCGGSSGVERFVQLGAGTFLYNGTITVPAYCYLNGSGANQTILTQGSSSSSSIVLGAAGGNASASRAVNITSGATAGSTGLTLSSASGVSVGNLLLVSELNNPTYVESVGSEGTTQLECLYGWGPGNGMARQRCEIHQVIGKSGNLVTISPPLLTDYGGTAPAWSASTYYGEYAFISANGSLWEQTYNNTSSPYHCRSGSVSPTFPSSPAIGTATVTDNTCIWLAYAAGTGLMAQAVPFAPSAVQAGIENLQIYDDGATRRADILIGTCMFCFVHGIEVNYTSDDWIRDADGFRNQIDSSYFSNSFSHSAGGSDVAVDVYYGTTGDLVENNIFERGHVGGVMLEEGSAANVIAYNYVTGQFDTTATNWNSSAVDNHSAHPQFNLFEGNVWNGFAADSTWGTSSHGTLFRNWDQGTPMVCNPTSTTRATVACSPYGHPGQSGANSWHPFQQAQGILLAYTANYYNVIGDVIGSSQAQAMVNTSNSALAQAASTVWHSGVDYGYGATWSGMLIGFSETSDSGSYALDSARPFTTMLQHGTYNNVSGSITWNGNLPHTLPASFFLSSKPLWWPSSLPWPAIGPDVTGGSGPGGYVYSSTAANPAENCYFNVMNAADGGGGSPLSFNAASCYPVGSQSTPASPTGLQGAAVPIN